MNSGYKKFTIAGLLPALIMSAGCAGTEVKASDEEKWAIDLAACTIEEEGTEAVAEFIGGIAIDYVIGKIKSAISNAAKDKDVKAQPAARTYSLSEFETACHEDKSSETCSSYEPRICFVIGFGSATDTAEWNPTGGLVEVALAKNDAELVGFKGRPVFLARVGWKASTDGSAIRPALQYLYYSKALNKGRGAEGVAISASGQLPGAENPFIGFEMRIPALVPQEYRVRSSGEILVDSGTLLWTAIPEFWVKTYNLSDGPSEAMPTNVSGSVVFTKDGSRFFKALDDIFNESVQSSLASELKSAIEPRDSRALQDEYSIARAGYLDDYAKFTKARSDYCADRDDPVLEATFRAALAAAEVAYNKYARAASKAGIDGPEPSPQDTGCA